MHRKNKRLHLAFGAMLALSTSFSAAQEEGQLPGGASADSAAAKPDIAAGEQKSQVCIACHGEEGVSRQANYPHLHGQQETYLLRQMRTFRDGGDRRDPIMTPMLENMTDQDLVNLAAYFASFANILGSTDEAEPSDTVALATPEISATGKAKARAASAGGTTADGEGTFPQAASAEAPPAPATAAPAAPPGSTGGDAAAGQTKSAACVACHGMDGKGTSPLFPNINGQKPEYLVRQLTAFRDGTRQDPTMAPMTMALSDQDIADLAAFYGSLQ